MLRTSLTLFVFKPLSNIAYWVDRKAFVPIHPPGTLGMLPPEAHLGPVDPATLPKEATEQTEEEKRIAKARANLPPPEAALNINDITVRFNLVSS